MKSHKELIVWQKSFQLCEMIYELTKKFPKAELFVLVGQMRTSAISVPSNIAEGFTRRTSNDFRQFLHVAYGSASELDTQLLLSKKLGYISDGDYEGANGKLEEVLKMLNKLTRSLGTSR